VEESLPAALDDDQLVSALESLLLVSPGPVSITALTIATGQTRARIAHALARLQARLAGGIRLQLHSGRAQLVTAPENAELVQRFLGTSKPAPLSRSALETVTVIAYRQPVTRAELEAARGVNSDRAIQTLLARGLIEELGKRHTLGRPTEYGTTFGFLEYFGLRSLDELPSLPQDEDVADGAALGMRSRT